MTDDNSTESRTMSLVLGSGGARGLAHIGAIKALEERGARLSVFTAPADALPLNIVSADGMQRTAHERTPETHRS